MASKRDSKTPEQNIPQFSSKMNVKIRKEQSQSNPKEQQNTVRSINEGTMEKQSQLNTLDQSSIDTNLQLQNILDDLVHLNKVGMEHLSHANFKLAHGFLKRAEKLLLKEATPKFIHTLEHSKLFSLTMNNLGCYYKK